MKIEENILGEAEKFLNSMEKENKREKAYDMMISRTKQILKETIETKDIAYLDIKEMQSLFKQMSLASNLAKEENYEIPIQMGDEITSINLKVIHRNVSMQEVRITMETEKLGKIDARFVASADGLEGSVLTDYMDGKNLLQSHVSRLERAIEEALKETKLELKSIFFGVNEKLDIQATGNRENDKKTDISLLYKVAKEFIYYVKDIKEA